MELTFYAVDVILPQRRRGFNALLTSLFKKEKMKCASLTYVFCSDEYLLKLNRQFLKHDEYTDIITFDLSEKGEPLNGEIYISVERVRENASELMVPMKEELHRVMIHGALHLCGYRDKTKSEKLLMRKREDYYLELLNRTK